jgi:hypothetical protein
MDFAAVHAQALEQTRLAKQTRDALLETPDQFVFKVQQARLKLAETILESAPAKILEAAARGASTADLYKFNGNDFLDDVSVLFLFKGPKPLTPPVPEGTPPPLLPELQHQMAPFDIVHDWDGISGGNRILARW